MSEDWERARQAVRDEVAARGTENQTQIAVMLGVSEATWRRFDKGRTGRPWLRTTNAIEDALGWPRGRLERIARGVDASAARSPPPDPRSREAWRAKMPDLPDDEFEDVWAALNRWWSEAGGNPSRDARNGGASGQRHA